MDFRTPRSKTFSPSQTLSALQSAEFPSTRKNPLILPRSPDAVGHGPEGPDPLFPVRQRDEHNRFPCLRRGVYKCFAESCPEENDEKMATCVTRSVSNAAKSRGPKGRSPSVPGSAWDRTALEALPLLGRGKLFVRGAHGRQSLPGSAVPGGARDRGAALLKQFSVARGAAPRSQAPPGTARR